MEVYIRSNVKAKGYKTTYAGALDFLKNLSFQRELWLITIKNETKTAIAWKEDGIYLTEEDWIELHYNRDD